MRPYVPRNIRQLRRLLKGMSIGMFTTQAATGASNSRPMLVHGVDECGWLWFLTDRRSRKACEIGQNPYATITFQSPNANRYVSVQGTAIVVRDDVKLRALWNPALRSWFPRGRRDPNLVVVAVRVVRAEYWLVPRSRLTRIGRVVKAILTGKRHENGRYGILDLHPIMA